MIPKSDNLPEVLDITNLPEVLDITNRYCEIVIHWSFMHRPERMKAYLKQEVYDFPEEVGLTQTWPGYQAVPDPSNVCDENMAMAEALASLAS